MNRSYDFAWNDRNITTPVGRTGADNFTSAGPEPVSEPEVQAIQNFLLTHPIWALMIEHTGEQFVLWLWCSDTNQTPDGPFMTTVSPAMTAAMTTGTGRNNYAMQSWANDPTHFETIDWVYGRLHLHAYTTEAYARGTGQYNWGDSTPPDQWIYMGNWQGFHHTWFRNTGSSQLAGHAPVDRDKMVKGIKDGFVVMAQNELWGTGLIIPEWMTWVSAP